MVVAKITKTSYYWPDMHMDSVKGLRKCDSCQRYDTPTQERSDLSFFYVAISKVGHRYHGIIPRSLMKSEVLGSHNQLFHKTGRSQTFGSISTITIKKLIWEFIICCFGLPQSIAQETPIMARGALDKANIHISGTLAGKWPSRKSQPYNFGRN